MSEIPPSFGQRPTLSEEPSEHATQEGGKDFSFDEHRGRLPAPIRCPHCHNLLPLPAGLGPDVACPQCGGSFRVEPAALPDTLAEAYQFGRFQLLGRLGRGSFGTVYRARDPKLDRVVAIKIPHASLFASPRDVERCLREARAVASLRHPGIVTLYETETVEGRLILVYDFIDGLTLQDLLAIRRLTFRESVGLMAEVADALAYAHAKGVVHRDVKPGNIMVERARAPGPDGSPAPEESPGKAVIVDFGLARREEAEVVLSVDGQILGTPAYMSPEQAAGKGNEADQRSDVYGLGVVLYELLCGELPFRGTKLALLYQVQREEPRPPRRINDKIPRDLETVCLKAMAKEPSGRYATARDFADDLRRFLRGEPVRARPVGSVERLFRWCRRNRVVAGLVFTVILSLAFGTAVASFLAVRASHFATRYKEEAYVADRGRRGREITLAREALKKGQVALAESLLGEAGPSGGLTDLHGFEWHYLRRLCHDELAALPGHRQAVQGVAFGPGGRRLASAGADGVVVVWDVARGVELFRLEGNAQPVYAVAFSPDGRHLATVGHALRAGPDSPPGEVKLWDLETHKARTLTGHHYGVWAVAFSPCGRYLAYGGGGHEHLGRPAPGELRLWDVRESREAFAPSGLPAGAVLAVAFSPDSRRLASAGEDAAIRVWAVSPRAEGAVGSLSPLFTLTGHTGPVSGLAFSPDGRLASTGFDQVVRVWSLTPPRDLFFSLRVAAAAWTGWPGNGAYAPSAPQLTLTGHTGPVHGLSFSPDGRTLASAGSDNVVRIWDTETGVQSTALLGHTGRVFGVAFSPDAWRLASAGEDKVVRLWDVAGGRNPTVLSGGKMHALGLCFSPDGRTVVTGGADQTVKVWDLGIGMATHTWWGHTGNVNAVSFAPDGRHLASASQDRTVKLWTFPDGENLLTLRGHTNDVNNVAYRGDGLQVASVSSDGTARLWDSATGQLVQTLGGHKGAVRDLSYGPDNRRLATAGDDGTVRVWDGATGEQLKCWVGHQGGVRAVMFSPDGQMLASGGADNRVILWSYPSGELLRTLTGHAPLIQRIAFSPDGERLVSAGSDQTVRLWDTRTGQQLLSLEGHERIITSVAFSQDGWQIASGSPDGTARVWDARTLTPDLVEQRRAIGVLDRLFRASRDGDDLLVAVQRDETVSDAVRDKVARLLGPYRQALVHRDAYSLIQSLKIQAAFRSDIEERVRTVPGLTEAVRYEAIRLSACYVESPEAHQWASWKTVRRPCKEPKELAAYRLALRRAELACRLEPDDGSHVITLGMAHYRLGNFVEAVESLTHAGGLLQTKEEITSPARLAFLAMAKQRLGEREGARAALAKLKEMMRQPDRSGQEEAISFLREAEALVGGLPTDAAN